MKAAPTKPDADLSPVAPQPAVSKPAGLNEPPYDTPFWLHFLGGLVHRYPRFWLRLGRFESRALETRTASIALRMPIYVCGLARSGSTLLHEVICSLPGVATHRIKDYPLVFTPYWWRRATANPRPQPPRERPHRDGMMITLDSPDAVEEMLWMAFFPRCHDPSVSNLLRPEDSHPAFESFYNAHLRKLLLAEGATRYASKNNYHVARLPYLIRQFPDARFLLPVRSPASHIASLMRQHEWFSAWHRQFPRALAFMQRSGHFEFGLDRRPIHLDDGARVRQIQDTWAAGDEVRGWARYWDMVYGHLARLLDSDAQVRTAALPVRFESIREQPAETLRAALEHCRLPDAEGVVERYAGAIRSPTSDPSRFSSHELDVIREETAATAGRWGY